MEILLQRRTGPDPLVGRVIRRASVALAAAAFSTALHAQPAGYPAKPIRVIAPFPAGGPVEVLARVFTTRLHETMGQPFVIENRAGASGTIGTELVARAPRDGYTQIGRAHV